MVLDVILLALCAPSNALQRKPLGLAHNLPASCCAAKIASLVSVVELDL